MSNPSLIAKLGIDEADFVRGMTVSVEKLDETNDRAKRLAAQMAVLASQMTGKGTQEQAAQYKALNAELRTAQSESIQLKKHLDALNAVKAPSAPVSQPSAGGHGGGGGRMAGMEAGHSIRSVFDMLGAGQNLGQALQMELPRLLQASGMGLGAMLGIQAATAIAHGLEQAIQSRAVEKENFGKLLAGPGGGGVSTRSTSSIESQIKELDKKREEMMDATGNGAAGNDGNIFSAMARGAKNTWRAATGQQSVEDEADDRMVALDQRRIQLSEEIVRRKAAEVAIDKRAATEGEGAVAIDRERLALKEKIAAVMEDTSIDGTAQARLVDLLREESALREVHIRQVKEQHAAEIEAREGALDDRENGNSNEVTRAQRALDEARHKQAATTPGTPEGKEADDAVRAARLELETAQRATKERQAQRDLVVNIAGMTTTQSEKERSRLEGEKRLLMQQLHEGSPTFEPNKEKQSEIRAKLAVNGGALHSLDRADQQRAFGRDREKIEAETGPGPVEQGKAASKKMSLNLQERADNTANENDPDKTAKLQAEYNQLKRQLLGIGADEKDRLDTIERQTEAIKKQGFILTGEEKKAKLRAQYQPDIDRATRQGDTATAEAKGRERDAAMANVDVEEAQMTPAQKRERAWHNQQRQRQVDHGAKPHTRDADREGSSIHNADGPDGSMIPNADKTGGNAYSGPDNVNTGSFDDYFKANPPPIAAQVRAPVVVHNRADAIRAGAENAGKGDGGFKDRNIVAAINATTAAVNAISLKNK